jgi:3-oxoacyl-(acyl-carrier-protein) synthase
VSPDNGHQRERPIDATRSGFVPRGAGFVVLEEWESARRRGAHLGGPATATLASSQITDSHPSGDGRSERCGGDRHAGHHQEIGA